MLNPCSEQLVSGRHDSFQGSHVTHSEILFLKAHSPFFEAGCGNNSKRSYEAAQRGLQVWGIHRDLFAAVGAQSIGSGASKCASKGALNLSLGSHCRNPICPRPERWWDGNARDRKDRNPSQSIAIPPQQKATHSLRLGNAPEFCEGKICDVK